MLRLIRKYTCGETGTLARQTRNAFSGVFKSPPNDVMQEFRCQQHVEADNHMLSFAPDHGAADFVMDAENFEEEVFRHRQVGADIQIRAVKGNVAHDAAEVRGRAQVMADEDDFSGRSMTYFGNAWSRGMFAFGSRLIFKDMTPSIAIGTQE